MPRARPLALAVLAVTLAVAPVGPSAPWGPSVARADTELEARLRALGAAREGERGVYEQVRQALETAERAAGEGQSARAERHRDLALALVRGLEARRRIAELEARVTEQRAAIVAARARVTAAHAAAERGETTPAERHE